MENALSYIPRDVVMMLAVVAALGIGLATVAVINAMGYLERKTRKKQAGHIALRGPVLEYEEEGYSVMAGQALLGSWLLSELSAFWDETGDMFGVAELLTPYLEGQQSEEECVQNIRLALAERD